jgi:signal transduction histidine kinase
VLPTWVDLQQAGAVNAEQQWTEIRFQNKDRQEYNFDVWARYIRAEESGIETSIMLVDRTLERQHEEMKVDFVAMAAHDLRAPVTVIRGYIETIADELEKAMTADQKNYMHKLDASAAQLSGFINNILNVAKVDRGKLNLSLQEGEWGTILRQAVDQLQIRAKAHGKTIELKIDSALPHVAVDPVSIIEVINNFVDNAIKYSGSNNERIIITARLNDKSEIETTVQDFGVGIPDNLVGKLFTKYYRSHRTQKEFGGTGLGLFISKAIIDAHHGHVWAQSKEGEGSTFGFSLPPYEKIAAKLEEGDSPTITRGTHGWIKNHSLYRI